MGRRLKWTMHNFFGLAVIGFPILLLGYFFLVNQLYEIVRSEKPEWLRYRGEPSFFYSGMPHRLDPNVTLRVIAVALSARARQLDDPSAIGYAWAIRVVLQITAALFAYICWYVSR